MSKRTKPMDNENSCEKGELGEFMIYCGGKPTGQFWCLGAQGLEAESLGDQCSKG